MAGIANRGPLGPLPLKTVMWVNPASVSIVLGYGGVIEELALS